MTIDTYGGEFSGSPDDPLFIPSFVRFEEQCSANARQALATLATHETVTAALFGSPVERSELRDQAAPHIQVLDEAKTIVEDTKIRLHRENAEKYTARIAAKATKQHLAAKSRRAA